MVSVFQAHDRLQAMLQHYGECVCCSRCIGTQQLTRVVLLNYIVHIILYSKIKSSNLLQIISDAATQLVESWLSKLQLHESRD